MQFSDRNLCLTAMLLAIVAGCSAVESQASTPSRVTSASSSSMVQTASSPSKTQQPVEPREIDSAFRGLKIEELMTTNMCTSPCVWGIMPSQTSYSDATGFLDQIANTYGDFPFLATVVSGSSDQTEAEVSFEIDLHQRDGLVGSVSARFIPSPGAIVASDAWAAFRLKEIFVQYGIPSDVRLASTQGQGKWIQYILLIEYKHYDFYIEYFDPGQERELTEFIVCPNSPKEYLAFSVHLGEDPLLEVPEQYYFSISQVSDFSIQDFYDFILKGRNECLQIRG